MEAENVKGVMEGSPSAHSFRVAQRHRLGRRPGLGVAFALLLLLAVEAVLHTDAFGLRYRAVFAAGRAMDKLLYVESTVPRLLIVGNSRVDNGFDPAAVAARLGVAKPGRIFNFGLPGSDTRTLFGLFTRLDHRQLLGPSRIEGVVIGLDEGYLRPADSLGYEVFFADRVTMLANGEYRDLARSFVRLWGFSDNLKELREPAKLERFIQATRSSVEPIGGGAAQFAGYRAGFGGLQDAAQMMMQEAGSKEPPDPARIAYLNRSLDLLKARGVRVAIVYPPLLSRDLLYLAADDAAAKPYLDVARQMDARGVPLITLEPGVQRNPAEFINAGHLNDRGAKRYSALLADQLARLWPDLAERLAQ
jgi:hypothetical protein